MVNVVQLRKLVCNNNLNINQNNKYNSYIQDNNRVCLIRIKIYKRDQLRILIIKERCYKTHILILNNKEHKLEVVN